MPKPRAQKELPEMPQPTRYRYIITVTVVECPSHNPQHAISHDHTISVELGRRLKDSDLRKFVPMCLDDSSGAQD